MLSDTNLIHKSLVGIIIEQTLLEIGDRPLFNEVSSFLYQNYGCYIPDCYDHPEYLLTVFKELDGSSYLVITDSIRAKLEEYVYNEQIRKILEKISAIECSSQR